MESQTKTLVNWKFINKSYENRILHRYARLAPDMYQPWMAFRQLFSRRATPSDSLSNNATQFKATKKACDNIITDEGSTTMHLPRMWNWNLS